MFHLTRRFQAGLPLFWLAAGLFDSLMLLALPSLALLAWLLLRHLRIVRMVGVAPWASVGFARHVMVDDLMRLSAHVLLSPVLYLCGGIIGAAL